MTSAFSMPPMRCSRPGGAGDRPRAGQRLRVAQVGVEDRLALVVGVVGLGGELDASGRAGRRRPGAPRLGAVGEVAVGQQEHRRAVGRGDPHRLDARRRSSRRATAGRRSAPATRRCGRTSPAAGRTARSWSAGRSRAAALDVDDDQRQLERDGEADRLGLEGDARAGGRGHAERAAEATRRAPRRRRRSRPRPATCVTPSA